MNDYRIAVIPGDGVGPEVAAVATATVRRAGEVFGFGVEYEHFDWGCDRFLETGSMMPEDALDVLDQFDAIFLVYTGQQPGTMRMIAP